MKKIIYKNEEMKELFLQSMEHFQKYYWTISTITSNTKAYIKLLQNKSKIGEIYVKDFQKKEAGHNTRVFHKTFRDYENVHLVSRRDWKKGEYSIHSKLYLFYTSDSDWRCFVGSFNLTDAAFEKNNEIALCIDSDSPGAITFLKQVWQMFDWLKTNNLFKEKETRK